MNWAQVATPEFWLRWIEIVILNLTLSGDNALVIALAVRKLPSKQQWEGRLWGTVGAVGLRIVFVGLISLLLHVPLLQAGGGVVLSWIAVRLLAQEGPGGEESRAVRQGRTLFEVIWVIVLADLIMSLDNVLAISGAAHGDMVLVTFGVGLSIPLVIWGSGLLARLMARFWWIVDVGAAILGWVAAEMILEDQVVQGWLGGPVSPLATRVLGGTVAMAVVGAGRIWARRRPGVHAATPSGSGH